MTRTHAWTRLKKRCADGDRRRWRLPVAIGIAGALAVAFWMAANGRLENPVSAHGSEREKPLILETPDGTIVAGSLAKARWAERRLRESVNGFAGIFGVRPGHGIIIESTHAGQLIRFDEDRRNWVLPWPPERFGEDESRSGATGLQEFDADSGIRHELHHLFLTISLFSGAAPGQYGSSAPDWFEEAVAIAGETAGMRALRRARFAELVCGGRLVPIGQFLLRQHPLFASPVMQRQLADARAAARDVPTMAVVDVQRLDVPEQAIADFYAQSHAVAEFLAETANDPRILARVGRALTGGETGSAGDPLGRLEEVVRMDRGSLAGRFEDWARDQAGTANPQCGVAKTQAFAPHG